LGVVPLIPEPNGNTEEFRKTLGELGYLDGQSVFMEWRWGGASQLPEQMADLVRLNVDVIVPSSSAAVLAAREATRIIPIVANDLESDPVKSGLAASLARPGGNLTGVFLDFPELSGKLLESMREIVPGRVAVLWDASMSQVPLRAMEEAARSLRVPIDTLSVRGPDDFAAAFKAASRNRARSLVVMQSPMLFVQRTYITQLAATNRLPMLSHFREFAEAGGLMSYGPDVKNVMRRLAVLVAKVLHGAQPAEVPIERPTRFDLVINLKTAKALSLTVPQSLLVRADEIIQ
jgi:putative ABC transport system substrate-binding protein